MPSQDHLHSLHRKVNHLDKTLVGLRTREAQLLTSLEQIRSEIKSTEEIRDELEAQKYPINRVPNEILVQIFVTFVEDTDCDPKTRLHNRFHYEPVLLSHVCHKWRVVALSVSQLWSTILLDPLTRKGPLEAFLTRSGNALLDVYGNAIDDEYQVRTRCRRWRTFSYTAQDGQSTSFIKLLWRDSYPNLTNLRLTLQSIPQYRQYPRDGRDGFPKLRSVYLQDVGVRYLPPDMFLHIRSLELGETKLAARTPMSALLDCLSSTLQLQELVLVNFVMITDIRPPSEIHVNHEDGSVELEERRIVKLPYLRELIWGSPQVATFRHFFSFLDLPSLHLLDLSLKNNDARRPEQSELSSYPFLHLRSVEDLVIECNHKDALTGAFREIDYPCIKSLELRTAPESKPKFLPSFNWSSYLRDPRLLDLTHLTLFRLQISQQHLVGSFRYMPALNHLTLDLCKDAQDMVCFLAELKCGCIAHHAQVLEVRHGFTNTSEDSACRQLGSLVFRDCDGLRIECLKTLIRSRYEASGGKKDDKSVRGKETGGKVEEAAIRKIKPLSKRFQHLTIGRPVEESFASSIAHAHRPVNLKSITLESCAGIEKDEALSLKGLGFCEVDWRGLETIHAQTHFDAELIF